MAFDWITILGVFTMRGGHYEGWSLHQEFTLYRTHYFHPDFVSEWVSWKNELKKLVQSVSLTPRHLSTLIYFVANQAARQEL